MASQLLLPQALSSDPLARPLPRPRQAPSASRGQSWPLLLHQYSLPGARCNPSPAAETDKECVLGLPPWSSGSCWVSRLLLLPADPVATASSDILFLFGFSCGVEYELPSHAHTHHLETDTALRSHFNLGLRTPGRPWTSLSLETGKTEPTPLPRAASQTSPQDFSHMPQFSAEHLKMGFP